MKIYKVLFYILIATVVFSSCKKAAKELSEKMATETVEKGAKNFAKETAEKSLKTLTKKELKNIAWADLLKIIRKENINLAEALSKLDKSFQKEIGKAINSDFDFFIALTSSNRMVDEFSIFVKNSPKAAKNIDLFKFFAKSRDVERRFGVNNTLGDFFIKEENGIIKLVNKNDNSLIGDLKDGILNLKQPFKEGSNLIEQNSLLKKTLIPNTTYKFKSANGGAYLYHVDNLGRFSKIEASGIDTKDLLSNIIDLNKNYDLGDAWLKKYNQLRKTSGDEKLQVSVFYKYIDDAKEPLNVNINIKKNGKKILSESFENKEIKAVIKKVIKEYTGEETIEMLSKKGHGEISNLIKNFERRYGPTMSTKNLFLQELEDGSIKIGYRGSPTASITSIEIKGKTIYAKAGSLPGKVSAQNQFLNNIIPNMEYVIDDVFIYKTDRLGRVVEASVDRSKLYAKNIKREGRASEIQKEIHKKFPGHDGGHIFDKGSGGPNEILNQVPMESKFNRNGEWKKLENLEKKAIAEGKKVNVRRVIKYSDDSTRPSEFITYLTIDGETQIITLKNPIP